MDADVVVIGGGPAGLATAIELRQRGLDVVVFDKGAPPLDKACGEGLMPPGVRALTSMGVHVAERGCAPFEGIRYIDGDVLAQGHFPSGPGLGVRRLALMEAMIRRAQELGAELRYRTAIDDLRQTKTDVTVCSADATFRARFVVGADGLHSPVRKRLGLDKVWRGRKRFGIRRHYGVAPWSKHVEVYWSDGVEAYVTPVGSQEVGVAMLYPGDGRGFETLLGRFPRLQQQLAGRNFTSSARGAGPFRQGVRRRYRGRVALVGDAAGYLDALTGEGLTLGFESAAALATVIANNAPLEHYEAEYRRLSRTYYRMTELLLTVGNRPALRRRVIRALAANPDLFDRMLAITSGEASWRDLGFGPLMRLMVGLAHA